MNFLQSLMNEIPSLTVVIIGLYALTFSFMFKKVQDRKKDRKEKQESFNITLLEGMRTETVNSIEDLLNIYKGVTDLASEDLGYRYGLNRWLRKLLVDVISKKKGLEITEDETHQFKEKLTGFIKINEQFSPFADLPDLERSMLSDITAFMANNDLESAGRKTKELGGIIITRYEEHKKLQKTNKRSNVFAIVGLILTIFFGIASLV